jgi:hypothetical protein
MDHKQQQKIFSVYQVESVLHTWCLHFEQPNKTPGGKESNSAGALCKVTPSQVSGDFLLS